MGSFIDKSPDDAERVATLLEVGKSALLPRALTVTGEDLLKEARETIQDPFTSLQVQEAMRVYAAAERWKEENS